MTYMAPYLQGIICQECMYPVTTHWHGWTCWNCACEVHLSDLNLMVGMHSVPVCWKKESA